MSQVATSSSLAVPPSRWPLLESVVQPPTRKRYTKAVDAFLHWLAERNHRSFQSVQHIDDLLLQYVHHCWTNAVPFTTAKNALYGLRALHPSFKTGLPLAKVAVDNWDKRRSKKSHPPMPRVVVYCIAVYMTFRGNIQLAIATLTAFHTYCRKRELLNLRGSDVVEVADPRLSGANEHMGIYLQDTKTGKYQYVRIKDPAIATLLLELRDIVGLDHRMFPFANNTWLNLIHEACAAFGFPDDLVVHSLRHGGATHDFIRDVPLPTIQVRGRWARFENMLRYVQAGRGRLIERELPRWAVDAGLLFIERPLEALAAAAKLAPSRKH